MKRAAVLLLAVILLLPISIGEAKDDEENYANFPKNGLPVLMYHSISTKYDRSICVSAECFEKQIKWLHDNGYHAINSDQLYDAFENGVALPDKAVMITFDDGFGDNYEVAWPILRKYDFVGTFFIVTDFVKSYSIDWEQLKDLIACGNSIGSHTVHHYNMASLNSYQQERELRDSKKALEEGLGINIKAFCYPYGGYNKATIKLLSSTGYSLGFTTTEGRVHYDSDVYQLKRVHICGGLCLNDFIKKVS